MKLGLVVDTKPAKLIAELHRIAALKTTTTTPAPPPAEPLYVPLLRWGRRNDPLATMDVPKVDDLAD